MINRLCILRDIWLPWFWFGDVLRCSGKVGVLLFGAGISQRALGFLVRLEQGIRCRPVCVFPEHIDERC